MLRQENAGKKGFGLSYYYDDKSLPPPLRKKDFGFFIVITQLRILRLPLIMTAEGIEEQSDVSC
jgi:hypothetical protein